MAGTGSLAPYDRSGAFQHLDVLGDGRERHVERLGELFDVRFPLGEPGQDRPAVELASAAKVSLSRSSSIMSVMSLSFIYPGS